MAGTGARPDRRTLILDAALQVILRDGIDGIRSQAVAREAGVSVALPHYYFPTLQDLLREVAIREDAAVKQSIDAAIARASDPTERLLAALADRFDASAERVRERIMVHTEFQRRSIFDAEIAALVTAGKRDRLGQLAGLVHDAQAAGRLSTAVEPQAAAIRLMGTADGLAMQVLIGLVAPGQAVAQLNALVAAGAAWGSDGRGALPALAAEPVPTEPADRRGAILDAVMRLIERSGIAGVHFIEVAEEAGVSRSLPRYYFPTIRALLQATFDRDAQLAHARVDRRATLLADDLERLRDAYAGEVLADPEALRPTWILWLEYLRLAARSADERTQAADRLLGWLAYDTAIVRELQREGRVAAGVDVDAAVQRLAALLNGAGALWTLGIISPDEYARALNAAIDDELGVG